MTNEECAQYFESVPHLEAWLAGRLPPVPTWCQLAMEPYAPAKKSRGGVPQPQTLAIDDRIYAITRLHWMSIAAVAQRLGLERTMARRSLRRLTQRGLLEQQRANPKNKALPQWLYRRKA